MPDFPMTVPTSRRAAQPDRWPEDRVRGVTDGAGPSLGLALHEYGRLRLFRQHSDPAFARLLAEQARTRAHEGIDDAVDTFLADMVAGMYGTAAAGRRGDRS